MQRPSVCHRLDVSTEVFFLQLRLRQPQRAENDGGAGDFSNNSNSSDGIYLLIYFVDDSDLNSQSRLSSNERVH